MLASKEMLLGGQTSLRFSLESMGHNSEIITIPDNTGNKVEFRSSEFDEGDGVTHFLGGVRVVSKHNASSRLVTANLLMKNEVSEAAVVGGEIGIATTGRFGAVATRYEVDKSSISKNRKVLIGKRSRLTFAPGKILTIFPFKESQIKRAIDFGATGVQIYNTIKNRDPNAVIGLKTVIDLQ